MRNYLVVLIVAALFIAADQTAITDNGIRVILKEDGTWQRADSIGGTAFPFATSADSQIVYLRDDGTWEYLYISDTLRMTQKRPKPVNMSCPDYPEEARKAGIEGDVTIHVLIEMDGSVSEAEILESSGCNALDEAALEAARKSTFKPPEKEPEWFEVPYKFRLN